MSRQPDLSAFPIPRKGGAKPIASEQAPGMLDGTSDRAGEGARASNASAAADAGAAQEDAPAAARPPEPTARSRANPDEMPRTGQVVATTVKLDESRYLRLAEAGKPGPGRMRRRTIQDMVVEALDEWFERRGL